MITDVVEVSSSSFPEHKNGNEHPLSTTPDIRGRA
jgi:hypothetical protein